MKKRALTKIIGIGAFHVVLYLWLVPFIIYPMFGGNGLKLTIAVAVMISVAVLGTLFINKNEK